MSNQKNPVNFFKDNLTNRLTSLIGDNKTDFEIKLCDLLAKMIKNEPLDTNEFELIGSFSYFLGSDISNAEIINKQLIENLRSRFSSFKLTNDSLTLFADIYKKIEVSMFEESKEKMKLLIDSVVTLKENPLELKNIHSQINKILKSGEVPVEFAKDIENSYEKAKLNYNDLLKFNSIINQQYVIYGTDLEKIAKLYSNKDFNKLMNLSLYYFDLQKFAVVYVDNILSAKETLLSQDKENILLFLDDEYFNKFEFEFQTFEEVALYKQKLIDEKPLVVKNEEEVDEIITKSNEVENNFDTKPDIFLRDLLEEITQAKIADIDIFESVINGIMDTEHITKTYHYMAKHINTPDRLLFEEVYPDIKKEDMDNYLNGNLSDIKTEAENIAKLLLEEIPADNLNRIITYVNNTIKSLTIKNAETKGYFMTQLNENGIKTWKHLQQMLGLIEQQNIFGKDISNYCQLVNYLETKTNAVQIFNSGNDLERLNIYFSYFTMLRNFILGVSKK